MVLRLTHSPASPASATIKVVSPEVSNVTEVPPVTPPPDRIEHLFLELCEKIREYRPRDDLASVEKAFRIASELHKGQLRQSGEPYMVHPLMVAHILADMRMDLVTIETGLLHDLVEDTRMTPEEIRKDFGDEVARCVDGVTKLSKLDIFNAEERQAESFRKMLLAMVDDIRVIIVKLADRLHNMRTLGYLSAERRAHVATRNHRNLRAHRAPPGHGQSARRAGRPGLPPSGSGSLRRDRRKPSNRKRHSNEEFLDEIRARGGERTAPRGHSGARRRAPQAAVFDLSEAASGRRSPSTRSTI